MARNKLINIHSVALNTAGDGPKLPTKDQIEYGEIAVNYLDGYETISRSAPKHSNKRTMSANI